MGVSDASFPSPKLKAKQANKTSTYSKNKRIIPSRKRKRHVRFDDSETIEYTTHNVSYSASQKSLLWWTKDERRDILENNRTLAQDFRHFHREQVQHCNDIFAQICCSSEAEDWSKRAKIELPTHIRGLESGVLRISKRYRRTHVQQVLTLFQAQSQSADDNDQAVSARAMRSSRPSRVMARIFGACDAAAINESNGLRRNRCRMLPTWW